MSDKTEEATPKRLKKAREEGDSGIAPALGQGVAFLAALGVVPAAVAALVRTSHDGLRSAIDAARAPSPVAAFDAWRLAADVLGLVVPILLVCAVASGVAAYVQTGGVIATKRLSPKLEKLNPITGLANLVSKERLFSVLRAFVGLAVATYLAQKNLRAALPDLAHAAGSVDAAMALSGVALTTARQCALVGLALAVVDLGITRYSWRKRLMMSKDEVKREHKESEGDPHQKAARERAHHEMLASIAVANVKQATVVVVNPTHLATALRYDEESGDEAPVVVATGEGDLARRIVDAARAYGVPVLRDVPLARALAELEIGQAIPEALYEAVAEIVREAWDEAERDKRGG